MEAGMCEVDSEGLDMLNTDENEYYSYAKLKNVISQNPEKALTIMSLNISSLPRHFNGLCTALNFLNFKPDIIGITETKITEKKNTYYQPYIKDYRYLPSPLSTSVCGSAGVFIKDSFDIDLRKDLDISVPGLFETVWFDINSNNNNRNKKITIGLVYRHPGVTDIPFFERRLEKNMSKLNCSNSNFYIFGDFNVNCLRYNEIPNIRSFVDMMHSNSAVNLVNKPTWYPIGAQRGRPSLLDHFYTNRVETVHNIGILANDISGSSGHFAVVATISANAKKTKIQNIYPYIRSFRDFNLEDFNASLRDFQDNVGDNLDTRFEKLNAHILSCINKHIPLRKRTRKEMQFALKPWITYGLKKSILKRNRLFRLSHVSHPNRPTRVSKYNKYKKTLEKALFAAQCNYYSNKIIECQNRSKALWKVINEITRRKKKSNTFLRKLKMENGRLIENPAEIANALNEYFINVGPNLAEKLSPSNTTFESYLNENDSPNNSFYISATCPLEILDIINSFSASTCEDPVSISPKIFKMCATPLSVILAKMINQCFLNGHFPKSLKVAKVIPIFKDGDEGVLGNWRPISITPCISKVIERIVKKRLVSFLKKHEILSKYQFGYRALHSTTHAILNICDNIISNFDAKKHTVSIFLDLSKGFDCVNHQILLKKLYYYGIRGVALKFFESYLHERKQYTFVNGVRSNWLTVLCGVPQGSVLGPLLFLLYTNDLANSTNFSTNLFADDTCLSLSGNNLQELNRQCNVESGLVENWFRANKLTTNSKKASKFLLSRYNNIRANRISSFRIKMGNIELERVKSVKYLGVMLDEGVTWSEQIDFLATKLSRSAGIFSKLRYYLNTKVLIEMYHALFNSHLQYAILCWGSTTSTNLNRLQILQNRAIRNITKSPRFFRLNNHYLNLRILKVRDLYNLEVAKFMHGHFHQTLPVCFSSFFKENDSHDHYTRSRSRRNYLAVNCRSARGQKSIKYHGPIIWNEIPTSCRNSSKYSFKKQYKEYIFSRF